MPVPYYGVASLGKKVILIDELEGCIINEKEKARFSAEHSQFEKVGADNVCFLQKLDEQVIQDIARVHSDYWCPDDIKKVKKMLDFDIDAIARIFNSEGWEIGLCNDVLRCATAYLTSCKAKRAFNFLVRIPTHSPTVRNAQKTWNQDIYMGECDFPSDAPDSLLSPQGLEILIKAKDNIQTLRSAPIPVGPSFHLEHTFFVVHCEGLHLLAFCGEKQPEYVEPELVDPLLKDFFNETEADQDTAAKDEIFKTIGDYFNDKRDPIFSQGVDLSLLEVMDSNSVRIRTYDHNVHREVPSHGNAAVAAAMVACRFGLIQASEARIYPRGGNQRFRFRDSYVDQDLGYYRVLMKKGKAFLEGPAEYNNSGVIKIGDKYGTNF